MLKNVNNGEVHLYAKTGLVVTEAFIPYDMKGAL